MSIGYAEQRTGVPAARQWDHKLWKSLAGCALASVIPLLLGVLHRAGALCLLSADNDLATVIALA